MTREEIPTLDEVFKRELLETPEGVAWIWFNEREHQKAKDIVSKIMEIVNAESMSPIEKKGLFEFCKCRVETTKAIH